ncbi:MAG: TolC family protein [Bacteroidia bacterium]|jgi:outer membrane protein TolC|nr:TolC family protein [Bacteroidia bacterium]
MNNQITHQSRQNTGRGWTIFRRLTSLLAAAVMVYSTYTPAVYAGNEQVPVADSVKAGVMMLRDFYTLMIDRHPVVKQAATFSEAAKAELRMSRGLLDPKLSTTVGEKQLTSSRYYTMWDNTLKVPTWVGIDLKAGFEANTGQFVSSDIRTPSSGLWYAGISVPLGQGLIIDERRNVIKQAQLLPTLAEADQLKMVNKLLLQATKDYWDWYFAWNRLQMLEEGYTLAYNRFQAVKSRALFGDLPTIDTVEALIVVQDRDNQRIQARADYNNAMLKVSNHLWGENGTPLELTAGVLPAADGTQISSLPVDSLNNLLIAAQLNHPEVVKLDVKGGQLAIERRYQADKLKPKLNFEYNMLAKEATDFGMAVTDRYYANNYKYGITFSYSLFLRQERGKLALTEIKQQQVAFEKQQMQRDIGTEINQVYNNWVALELQLRLQEQQVQNTELLRDGEQRRFDAGESSFFLVNTRETALISAQIKFYEMQAKYAKTKAELYWAAGRLIAA